MSHGELRKAGHVEQGIIQGWTCGTGNYTRMDMWNRELYKDGHYTWTLSPTDECVKEAIIQALTLLLLESSKDEPVCLKEVFKGCSCLIGNY